MPESYGQFCPVAQAAEVLAERWTLLVDAEVRAMAEVWVGKIELGAAMPYPDPAAVLAERSGG